MPNMQKTKTPMPSQDASVRARNWYEVALGYTAEDMATIRQAAADHGLLLTGGTDFHGYFSEEVQRHPLGSYTASDEMLARFDELSAKLR